VRIFLKVWRQAGPNEAGQFVDYTVENVSADMSFLEMLDVVNEDLIRKAQDPIAFESDCREGICGSCGFMIDGIPHGPEPGTTVCQLHMRRFSENIRLTLEPWRARAFPIIKDLVVDRSAFDRIIQAGGYTSINVGGAQDGNTILIPKNVVEQSMDSAACIGCGACVASCPNGSAMLFVAAKVAHLGLLPQGKPERADRVRAMVDAMDAEGFGACTNTGECEAVCPKEITLENIAFMNRDFMKAIVGERPAAGGAGGP
jgi:succinate dehydrogenase / fumarate reductase iron-sulfur subunit